MSNYQRPGGTEPFQRLKGARVGQFVPFTFSLETEEVWNIDKKNSRKKMAFSSSYRQEVLSIDTHKLVQWGLCLKTKLRYV